MIKKTDEMDRKECRKMMKTNKGRRWKMNKNVGWGVCMKQFICGAWPSTTVFPPKMPILVWDCQHDPCFDFQVGVFEGARFAVFKGKPKGTLRPYFSLLGVGFPWTQTHPYGIQKQLACTWACRFFRGPSNMVFPVFLLASLETAKNKVVQWMDEILHHLETMGHHGWLVFTGGIPPQKPRATPMRRGGSHAAPFRAAATVAAGPHGGGRISVPGVPQLSWLFFFEPFEIDGFFLFFFLFLFLLESNLTSILVVADPLESESLRSALRPDLRANEWVLGG